MSSFSWPYTMASAITSHNHYAVYTYYSHISKATESALCDQPEESLGDRRGVLTVDTETVTHSVRMECNPVHNLLSPHTNSIGELEYDYVV